MNISTLPDDLAHRNDPRIARLNTEWADESFVCIPAQKAAESGRILYVPLQEGDDCGARIAEAISMFRGQKRFRALSILPIDEPSSFVTLKQTVHDIQSALLSGALQSEFNDRVHELRALPEKREGEEHNTADHLAVILRMVEEKWGPCELWSNNTKRERLEAASSILVSRGVKVAPLKDDGLQLITMSPLYRDPDEHPYSRFYRELGLEPPMHPRYSTGTAVIGAWMSDIQKMMNHREGMQTYFRRQRHPYTYSVNDVCPDFERMSPAFEGMEISAALRAKGVKIPRGATREFESLDDLRNFFLNLEKPLPEGNPEAEFNRLLQELHEDAQTLLARLQQNAKGDVDHSTSE